MSIQFGLVRVLQSFAESSTLARQSTAWALRSQACSVWRPFSLATAWPAATRPFSIATAHCPQCSRWIQENFAALQRRYKHGHKKKSSFMERIKKTAAGLFVARHPHYRHKRYNKTKSQLNRLKGTFVLPSHMQRKLRKAGF